MPLAGSAIVLVGAAAAVSVLTMEGAIGAGTACIPRWRVVASSANVPSLVDVAAVSPTDVWAVAGHEIVRWDGRKLRMVLQSRARRLNRIAAASATDVWAVGDDAETGRPFVMHWNGRRWQVVGTPTLRGRASLSAVTAVSRNDVWAVGNIGGRPLAMHWDGRRWRVFRMLEGALSAVDGASPASVWAVGAQGLESPQINAVDGLVMRWDGRRWKEVDADNRDDGDLGYELNDDFSDIDAVSPSEAWVTHNSAVRGDIQRWDGSRWQVKHVLPVGSYLASIAAVSPNDVWAGGGISSSPYGGASGSPLLVHWDGHSWRVQKTPSERLRPTLISLSALSRNDIWAVGGRLMARYSC